MARMGSGKREALGLMIDGRLLRVAHLVRQAGQVSLQDIAEAELPQALGEEEEEELPQEKEDEEAVLGLDQPKATDEVEVEEAGDAESVLTGFLGRFPLRNVSISINLSPTRARFSEFPDDFGLRGKKLAQRVLDTLREAGRPELPPERVQFVRLSDGRLLSVDHDDPMPLLEALRSVESFLGGNLRFGLVDAEETALLALVGAALPEDEKLTALAHVGRYTSQLLFFRGRDFLRAGNPLHLGSASPDIADTLARRMGLAQEEAGLPELERIVLTGLEENPQVTEALTGEFAQAEIQYFCPPSLDVSLIEEKDRGKISAYAVPIALAWKTLDPSLAAAYPIDFLPPEIREAQKTLRLAWHGFLFIGLTIAAVAVLSIQARNYMNQTLQAESEMVLLKTHLETNRQIMEEVNQLDRELSWYTTRLGLVDSLSTDYDRWSRLLRTLSQGTQQVGSVWFQRLSALPDGSVELRGRSLRRDRIPRVEALFASSHVREVNPTEVREIPVYTFDMRATPHKEPGKTPSGGSPEGGAP